MKLPNMHSTTWNGLDIVIEWPKGSTRVGEDKEGNPWKQEMVADYGYIDDTSAKGDEEPLDVYIGPEEDAEKAYAIEQLDDDGEFDEWKVMLGFSSFEEAQATYLAHYPDGWDDHIGDIQEIPIDYLFDMVSQNQQ